MTEFYSIHTISKRKWVVTVTRAEADGSPEPSDQLRRDLRDATKLKSAGEVVRIIRVAYPGMACIEVVPRSCKSPGVKWQSPAIAQAQAAAP